MIPARYRLIALLAITCTGCLIGSDLRDDLVAKDYYFNAFDSPEQTAFVRYDGSYNHTPTGQPYPIVPAPVTAAGWDQRWVLIRQGTSKYFIFDLDKERLSGPWNESQFQRQRKKLSVPSTLELNVDYSK